MRFSERLYTFVHLYETVTGLYMRDFYCLKWNIFKRLTYCRMDIVDQCSIVMLISVFGCHTNAFIIKCT